MQNEQTFQITPPPGVNSLYRNVAGRGRVKTGKYKAWIGCALKEMLAQRVRPVEPPVAIEIMLPAKMRGDLDGRSKGLIDLLVRAEIIPDDNKAIVRSLSMSFHDEELTKVCVRTIVARAA